MTRLRVGEVLKNAVCDFYYMECAFFVVILPPKMELLELKKVSLFERCTQEDLEQLLAYPHKRKEYAHDELVIGQGDLCQSLMCLVHGTVLTTTYRSVGRGVMTGTIHAPHLVVPGLLYREGSVMPVDVRAKGSAVVWHINRHAFHDFMQRHAHVKDAFIRALSHDTQVLVNIMQTHTARGVQEKIHVFLDQYHVVKNISTCAKILGVERPSLSRAINEMIAQGILVRTAEGIVRK